MKCDIVNSDFGRFKQITKALVLRTHSLGFEMTDSVMRLFGDPQLGKQASEGFDIIIGDDELVLNKASFAVIKVRISDNYVNRNRRRIPTLTAILFLYV